MKVLTLQELKERKRLAAQEKLEKEQARKAAFLLAREDSKKSGSTSRLKELLGRELWFEEKVGPFFFVFWGLFAHSPRCLCVCVCWLDEKTD